MNIQIIFTFHKFIFVFTKFKQYLTEIDHEKEDERRGSDENDNEKDETTYRTEPIHITQKTEMEVTTSASVHIKPECQHVDDGKYNNFVDTS